MYGFLALNSDEVAIGGRDLSRGVTDLTVGDKGVSEHSCCDNPDEEGLWPGPGGQCWRWRVVSVQLEGQGSVNCYWRGRAGEEGVGDDTKVCGLNTWHKELAALGRGGETVCGAGSL